MTPNNISLLPVTEKFNTPFLKIEIDYSQSDVGQIRTRVEAFLEMVSKK